MIWRRFRLFARRNPLAAFGNIAAVVCLAAFVIALALGYVKTSRALEVARREQEKATCALEETRNEAVQAAQSLAAVVTQFKRGEGDPRDAELRRALKVLEALAARFPDDETIKASIEEINKARERRANQPRRPRVHTRGYIPRYRPIPMQDGQ